MSYERESGRVGRTLDRIESVYLVVLRAAVLAIATVLLAAAIIWAAISLYRVTQSPASVVEKPSIVAATDLLTTEAPSSSADDTRMATQTNAPEQRAFYDKFVRRYFALYASTYRPYQRAEDKRLSTSEFDDVSIDSDARLRAIREGTLDFATDRDDLEGYLRTITEVSDDASTKSRLVRYARAQKQRVTTRVQRTRAESRRGWDSLSTACTGWYESPIGCAVTRRVEVPYSETVTAMRYPDGVQSPIKVLKSYQDRYFTLLAERREASAAEAERQRSAIVSGQIVGWRGLIAALAITGAFLVLMFFFLLVAIERHQRILSKEVRADRRLQAE